MSEQPHDNLVAAAIAAGAGVIALGTLGLEIWTDRWLARAIGWNYHFISAPVGVVAPVIAALVARHDLVKAAPGLGLGAAYWSVFLLSL